MNEAAVRGLMEFFPLLAAPPWIHAPFVRAAQGRSETPQSHRGAEGHRHQPAPDRMHSVLHQADQLHGLLLERVIRGRRAQPQGRRADAGVGWRQ